MGVIRREEKWRGGPKGVTHGQVLEGLNIKWMKRELGTMGVGFEFNVFGGRRILKTGRQGEN